LILQSEAFVWGDNKIACCFAWKRASVLSSLQLPGSTGAWASIAAELNNFSFRRLVLENGTMARVAHETTIDAPTHLIAPLVVFLLLRARSPFDSALPACALAQSRRLLLGRQPITLAY